MTLASACVMLLALWTLLAYVSIPLPLDEPVFAWLRRQWLLDGVAGLSCLGAISAAIACWRRRMLPRIPWWTAWLAWVTWAIVSLAYSIDRGVSLRAALAFLSYGLLAYVLCALIRSSQDLKTWMRFLVAAAVVVGVHGVFQYADTFNATVPLMQQLQATEPLGLGGWQGGVLQDFLARKRIFSVFGWPNLLAGFLLLMIPLAAGLSADAASRRGRLGWGAATGLLGLCLILTLSLGGWMAAVLTAAVAWWLTQRQRRTATQQPEPTRRGLMRMVILGLALCGIVFTTSYIVARRARPWIASSTKSRVVYALGALNVIRTHPVTGTGLGTFRLAYEALMPTGRGGGAHAALHAHNTFLEIGAELGIIGLAGFLALLWPIASLISAAFRRQEHPVRPLVQGLAIGVLGFFLHSLLEQTFFETVTAPFWWLALGLLTGACAMAPSEPILANSEETSAVGASPPVLRPVVGRSRAFPSFPPGRQPARTVALPLLAGVVGLCLAVRLAVADGWAARGVLRDRAGDVQGAASAFENAQRWDPLASRYPLEHGMRLLGRLRQPPQEHSASLLEQARQQLQRVVELSPWQGSAWMQLGLVSWQLGRSEELIPIARQLQHLTPTAPSGWFWEALAWQQLAEPARARQAYEAVLERFPEHPPSLFNLAELLWQEGDLEGAARAYQAFVRMAPAQDQRERTLAQQRLEKAKAR
jgi:putative inorganic carbon (HCO3(-)) transporter